MRENKRLLNKHTLRIAQLDNLVKTLYESFAAGSVPEKHFKKLVAGYDEEQAKLEKDISEIQAQLDKFVTENINVDKFIKLVKKHTDFTELTTSLLHEFVEKIIVHEGTKNAIIKRHYAGLQLTDEEFSIYRKWQDKKTAQAKAWRHRQKEKNTA